MRNAIPSSVYVLRAANGRVKIGRSVNPDQRRRALKMAQPDAAEIELCHTTPLREDSSCVESAAHHLLSAKRANGEWFDVTIDEAIEAIRQATSLVESGRWPPSGRQINVRVDEDVMDAIEEVRKLASPIPTVTEVVTRAILELRDRERKRGRK